MRPSARALAQTRRGSFSMTEMTVASSLAALVMILVATTWTTFGKPALEVEARARIEQEGILAAQSLACDLGGFLADLPGRSGTLTAPSSNIYQFTGWDVSHPGVLLLNYAGPSTSPVITVCYQLQGSVLERTDYSTGVTTPAARYVSAFSVGTVPGNSAQIQIAISISYSYFTSTFTLIGIPPS